MEFKAGTYGGKKMLIREVAKGTKASTLSEQVLKTFFDQDKRQLKMAIKEQQGTEQ